MERSEGDRQVLSVEGLAALLDVVRARGHALLGPRVRDGAIVNDPIEGIDDLPRGVGDAQIPGGYRVRARGDDAYFGFAAPAQGFKREFLAPRTTLVRVRRGRDGPTFDAPEPTYGPRALVGARACDLAAIAVQDRTLLDGPYRDPDYAARRANLFVIAVVCGDPSGTCFCASQDTGPRPRGGFDLALTELFEPHRFLVEIGSEEGRAVLAQVEGERASEADLEADRAVVEGAIARMGRTLDNDGIRDLLLGNPNHPRWDDVAARCLGCANCTMACPTCFCTTVEDFSDLEGETAERVRRWDSCFTMPFSHVHGAGSKGTSSVRATVHGRYRQWMTHKLASWWDQFDVSGCVGCGRCITWCPVGIDITEEAAAIRATDMR